MVILIAVVIPAVLCLWEAEARQLQLEAGLRPVGESHLRGRVEWGKPEAWYPMNVRLAKAEPFSTVELAVCGPSIDSSTGQRFDRCWPVFVNESRVSDVEIDDRGKARLQMLPKTYAGPYLSLVKAERIEVYGDDQVLLAVGRFKVKR